MRIHLAYGKSGLDVEVPERNLVKVLSMDAARPVSDPHIEISRALTHPIGLPPFSELAAGAKSACVVICDITRPAPNTIMLPPVLETLERSGIRRNNTTILVATGLHRPNSYEELKAMVGEDIQGSYKVVNHHARVLHEQRFLGVTENRTRVYIDEEYCSADLKITTGFIEPHLMAGFSGGRKMVAPGCAGEETIKTLHSPFFLEDPYCCEGSIEKNPLHHELLEIAAMAGHNFIVNVSLDASGRITGVFSGGPIEAHAVGVEAVRRSVRSTVSEPADIVITTSAGFPLDLTYYQAVKGITAALPVVRKGGMLILVAECAEGLGSEEFSAMATSFSSADAFLDWILKNPVSIDQWQLEECAKGARHADVVLVSSGIKDEQREKLFVHSANTVEEALERGLKQFGSHASVAVIPKGPYTLVEVEAAQA